MKNQFGDQKSHLKNEAGIALPLVLITMLILVIFGTTAYTASQSSLLQSTNLERNLECRYLARSAVDATREAWTHKWLTEPDLAPTNETFYNKYDADVNEFVQIPEAEYSNNDYVIKTVQTYDSDTGICNITSTAKIGGHSATVKAVSEKLTEAVITDVGSNSWYGYKPYSAKLKILGLEFNLGNWSEWTILPGSKVVKKTDSSTGVTYDASYHITDGRVVIESVGPLFANGTLREHIQERTGQTLTGYTLETLRSIVMLFRMAVNPSGLPEVLNKDGNSQPINYSVTGLQAKKIEFRCPLNLYSNSSVFPNSGLTSAIRRALALVGIRDFGYLPNPHSLIIAAETIIFDEEITIGNSSIGNLTLALPPGGGIPGDEVYRAVLKQNAIRSAIGEPLINLDLIDTDARYGMVRFNDKVTVRYDTSRENRSQWVQGQTFFFLPTHKYEDADYDVLSIGTEYTTFTFLTDRFGEFFMLGEPVEDTRFQTLIEKGLFIPGTIEDLDEYGNIVFHYE